ncbi:MAG: hypothetical protein U0Q55_17250 [Vicinamibacterales bacterium]
MDTANLSWRDKVAIVDTTLRIALAMFLAMAGFCELLLAANS